MNCPNNLKYTKEHEWVLIEDNIATVGITDFAQSALGDIVYVDVESVGTTLSADEVFGSVEAVKTVSDLFLPLSGKIIEINNLLIDSPELVNTEPYGNGWIIKIDISDIKELDNLLDSEEYKKII